jgi:hypothetical protein
MLVTSTLEFDEASKALIAARSGLVSSAKKTGDVIGKYADAMCVMFNVLDDEGDLLTPWYDLTHKAKSGVKAERAHFAAEMLAAGFETPTVDVYWQRVKEASGYVTAKNRVSGSTGVDAKNRDGLQVIINRIFAAGEAGDSSGDISQQYKRELMDIFSALGGDIMKIGTKSKG